MGYNVAVRALLALPRRGSGQAARQQEVGGFHALPQQLARPSLSALRDTTGESAQLFVRQGDARVCLASLQSPHGLRTIVAAGEILPLDQGSGGRVLLDTDGGAWVATVEEREAGVASVSAPVHDRHGTVVAAVSVSGPIERLTRDPGSVFGPAVVEAARRVAQEAGLQ